MLKLTSVTTDNNGSFGTLRIFAMLKHDDNEYVAPLSFGTLRIFAMLKHDDNEYVAPLSFGTLRIFAMLKPYFNKAI